jgi:hypothetical protein
MAIRIHLLLRMNFLHDSFAGPIYRTSNPIVNRYLGKVLEFSPGEDACKRGLLKAGSLGRVLGKMVRIEEEGVLR